MRGLSMVLAGLVWSGVAFAQEPAVDVKTEYLASLEVKLGEPQNVGKRFIVPSTGGSITGPKIHAELIPPSGDWLIPMPDGTLRLDVRQSFKADDGEILLFEVGGVITTNKELMDRFGKGETLTPKDEYFVTAATIATTSKKYSWLSNLVVIGKMSSVNKERAKLDLYAVY